MLKYLSKFTLDILPSVVATIIGAYIVNHYIVTKPGTVAPVAAVVSTTEPKAGVKAAPEAAKADASTDVANIPEPGVRAKGISEKVIFEKSAVEKPVEKSAEKPAAEKPAEAVSIPADIKRRPAPTHEKAVAKVVPAPAPPSAPAVVAVPNPAPPVEAAIAPDAQPRDANDLARAAIERLRANDNMPRPQETARLPDVPRIPDASRVPDPPRIVLAPPIQPLPPPIVVATPATEPFDSTTGSVRAEDPRRPIPPADIPSSRPLDLRAEAMEPAPRPHTNVAEDVLLAAKSVIHKVLPTRSAN